MVQYSTEYGNARWECCASICLILKCDFSRVYVFQCDLLDILKFNENRTIDTFFSIVSLYLWAYICGCSWTLSYFSELRRLALDCTSSTDPNGLLLNMHAPHILTSRSLYMTLLVTLRVCFQRVGLILCFKLNDISLDHACN